MHGPGVNILVIMGLMEYWRKKIRENIRNPSSVYFGRLVTRWMEVPIHSCLEQNAAALCNIQEDHTVLEIGFGPGFGLKAAAKYIRDGKVFGAEMSQHMYDQASKRLQSEIASGKVEIVITDGRTLPFQNTVFDSVFHVNCYYFWDDKAQFAKEILRVLKPGGVMVCTFHYPSILKGAERGFITPDMYEPQTYINACEQAGFINVNRKEIEDEKEGTFSTVFAYAP